MQQPNSLRKQIQLFGKENFHDVFPPTFKHFYQKFLTRLNSKRSWMAIVFFPIFFILIGQFLHPSFLEIIEMPDSTATIIIDQRISNLATIFSITLVVIGWLLTNISVKESISYELLFKRTYLYPIFYYVMSLISCLILASLLRHVKIIDLGAVVISATYLILFAFILIAFLFIKLISVVGNSFFYNSLEKEVMNEVYKSAKIFIYSLKSKKLYSSCFDNLGFKDKRPFGFNSSKHKGINITPTPNSETAESWLDFGPSYSINDIKLTKIESLLKSLKLTGENYYQPLELGSTVSGNFLPFVLEHFEKFDDTEKKIRKAFVLQKAASIERNQPNLEYLHEKFKSDVKERKTENIKMALEIYSKIFDLENKIIKECL